MAQEVLENKKNIPIYTGWNQELYDALTPAGKKGYFIAAIVHDGVKRKDGSWYLVHVNRSLQFFHSHKNLFGTKFDASNIERNIALHDCAEDLGCVNIKYGYNA